jgi:xylulokinase
MISLILSYFPRFELMNRQSAQILTIDIGTGSVRAALVDELGRVSALCSITHKTHAPKHSWTEQDPLDWWLGALKAIRATLRKAGRKSRVDAVIACGQMHAPVLINKTGQLVRRRVPLWNDKRAAEIADEINSLVSKGRFPASINPATSAWPGIKLHWMARYDPDAINAAWRLLMPKDYLNFRLTGEATMDWTEAASSFIADTRNKSWSLDAMEALELPSTILPTLLKSEDLVGKITKKAADETGLPIGTPVFAGSGDFPAAILGSGVTREDQLSDVTGTSLLLTRPVRDPLIHPNIMNVGLASGGWGAFAVVDAAGDAIRWASRVLDRDTRTYAEMSAEAGTVAAGAEGLIFLPYITGERLGQGPTSRGAFLGLTVGHRPAHLHRAVMEGIVLAMQEAFQPIQDLTKPATGIVSAAGGARSDLWLQIKADIFGLPVSVLEEVEAGLVGSAALALVGLGHYASPSDASKSLVRYRPPIMPDPDKQKIYQEISSRYAAIRKITRKLNSVME